MYKGRRGLDSKVRGTLCPKSRAIGQVIGRSKSRVSFSKILLAFRMTHASRFADVDQSSCPSYPVAMLPEPKRKTRFRRNANNLVEEYDAESGEVLAIEAKPDFWEPAPPAYKPLVFSPILSDQIIDEIENGLTLTQVLKKPGMPRMSTILLWAEKNAEFGSRLERARRTQATMLYDRVIEIGQKAESGLSKAEIESLKLAVSTYQWGAEKADQERYGTRKAVQDSGTTIIINTGIERSPIIEVVDKKLEQE